MRAALVLLLLATVVAAKPDAEAKLKTRLAKVWVDYARWLKLKGLKTDATDALARARAADTANEDLDRLATDIEALIGDAAADPGLDARRKKAFKDAAKTYDKLAKVGEEPRFEGYLFEAARLDPSKARLGKITGLIKKLAGNRKSADKAGRLLVRLREIDPAGRYDALEIELARKDVALIQAKDHPMVGYLSLPKGWKKGGSFPVLVAVDGAGSNFLGAGRKFGRTRGSRKFIVLAPCSLSNTNELLPKKYPFYSAELLEEHDRNRIAFDLAGLEGLLAVVAERFGGESKIGITGFSGGGNLCYAMTLGRPERIRFSAPACANFGGMGLQDARPVEGGGPPIHVLTGANDQHKDFTHGNKNSPGIEPQTDNAMQAMERLAFRNVRRTMLSGVGHSPCHKHVWDFADQVK